eukprot:g1169.t1
MAFNKGMVRVGAGLPGLLKDGYKHLSGLEEAIVRNIEAVKKLAQITQTSLGPNGRNKLVINHLEKLFITSDAAVICKELEVIHPAANVTIMAVKQQEEEVGDATNLVITFIGSLLREAENLFRMGVHVSEVVLGYAKAYKKALQILEALAVTEVEDLNDLAQVTKALAPIVASKQYGAELTLTPLIAEACLNVAPRKGSKRSFNVDNVRVAKLVGGSVSESKVIKGVVVERDTQGTVKRAKNANVAVFAMSIEASSTEAKGTVLIKNAEDLMAYSKSEETLMEKQIKAIANSGTNIVVSGGSISQMAMHFIEKYGMMALKITSKFELRRICRAVNATAVIKLGPVRKEDMGHCENVEVIEVGDKKVTVFQQTDDDSRVATIVLRGSTMNILDDLERAVDDGVNTYKTLRTDARLVPGAGATEIELAHQIRQYAKQCPGLDQYAIVKFAEALEVVPRVLAENSGQRTTEVLADLYAAHEKGGKCAGVDIKNGGVLKDANAAGISDVYYTKKSAFDLALEATLTVLRVDQIIMAKRAGGPKPRGDNPNWDQD